MIVGLPQQYLLLKGRLARIVEQLVQVSRETICLGIPATQLLFILFLMTALNQLGSLEL